MMARDWQQISLEEARSNPLYGAKNWLAVFASGVLMVPLREYSEISSVANDAGIQVSEMLARNDAVAYYAKIVFAFECLMVVVIFWLLFTKHRSFRPVASLFLLASWPVFVSAAVITELPAGPSGLSSLLFPWILSCSVWVTYLQRSRRVRVTFENAVLVETQGPLSTPIAVPPIPDPSRVSEWLSSQLGKPGLNSLPPTKATPASQANMDEEVWSQALREFEGVSRRQGLWARVFAEADGNDSIAKARYLKERAGQIADEERRHQEEHVAMAKNGPH